MKIIFYGLWLITIVAGSILGTIVPPSAVSRGTNQNG